MEDLRDIQQIADRLGVGVTTVRQWADRLGIEGGRTSSGKRIFSDEEVRVFEVVASLRGQDLGLDTIARRIGRVSNGHAEEADDLATVRNATDNIGDPMDSQRTIVSLEARLLVAEEAANQLRETVAAKDEMIALLQNQVDSFHQQVTDLRAERDRLLKWMETAKK